MNCAICGGSGLIPFKNREGKVIPNAFEYCECHHPEAHEHETRPEDFDFPMSYSFYRSLRREHGWSDPGPDTPPEPVEPQVVEHSYMRWISNMSRQDWVLLQQMARKAEYLDKKLTEHLEYKKKRISKYT